MNEQQSNYYTPDISELYVGYECERYEPANTGTDYMGHYYASWDKRVILKAYDIYDFVRELSTRPIRTKYLDKADLEASGWQKIADVESWMGKPPMYAWSARLANTMMAYNPKDHTLVVDVWDPTKTADGKADESYHPEIKFGRFRGYCKSINELRTIMKLLNIA